MSFRINTVIVDDRESTTAAARKHVVGMLSIGEGMYSEAYGDDTSPHVVKLMCGRDKGYRAFLEVLAVLDLDNPYLPKIHSATLYRYADGSPNYSNMNQYHPCEPGKTSFDKMVIVMEKLTPGWYMQKNKHRERTTSRWARRVRSAMFDAMNDTLEWHKYSRAHQELFTVILLAVEMDRNRNYGLDLHADNAMLRGRQLVVTDPLS